MRYESTGVLIRSSGRVHRGSAYWSGLSMCTNDIHTLIARKCASVCDRVHQQCGIERWCRCPIFDRPAGSSCGDLCAASNLHRILFRLSGVLGRLAANCQADRLINVALSIIEIIGSEAHS